MYDVRPKKSLGQHFLTDQSIAKRIVEHLSPDVTGARSLTIEVKEV